jgi:acyl carrier protein phosphodiesterase
LNYLAHSYLSNRNEGLIIGNFIADHLKGLDISRFPEQIARGIIHHREIDGFTDSHAAFRESKRFFYKGFEKYSGVLVDIYFDHFLAHDFRNISGSELPLYAQGLYEIYSTNAQLMPESAQRFLSYVIKNNAYVQYADISSIRTILMHLSGRIGRSVDLSQSVDLFVSNERQLHSLFEGFMGDAVTALMRKAV